MKKIFFSMILATIVTSVSIGQTNIDFKEFTLDNGLHVIMHQDNTTPIVTTVVLYHVGSKNENPERTGFAHFFEHLMFEGSENIPRGEYFNIIESEGGTLNAFTSQDITLYYEVLPSNKLELGLYMESERMLHANVDQVGVDTQRDVIKEEMKQVMDERPYGSWQRELPKRLFDDQPYSWPIIGSADHLDASTLEEFMAFYNTYYVPNNATLSIAGDIDYKETEALVRKYFGEIPMGTKEANRPEPNFKPLNAEIRDTIYDNIQLPAIMQGYRIPPKVDDDMYALNLLSSYLLSGKSALMYKELVDKQQKAITTFAFPLDLENGGMFLALSIANMGVDPGELDQAMDDVLEMVKKDGISDRDFEKLMNIKESETINSLASVTGIAQRLAQYKVFYGDANYINEELEKFRQVKPEDIKRVANKYLDKNNRVVLTYLPQAN